MKLKVLTLLTATLISTMSLTHAADLIYRGKSPVALEAQELTNDKNQENYGRAEISYILNEEARVRTVSEAINLKTRGLQFVRDIYDFEYLTTTPFANPSDAYINAVGDFIVNYVGNYVFSAYDFNVLKVLEARAPKVNQAIAIKTVGLRVRMQIGDFVQLAAPSIGNPSDAYKTAISTFTANNIGYALDYYSMPYMIVEAEKFTTTVADAMKVKNAGLVAVHNRQQLFELAAYSVPNPSTAYQNAVTAFIRDNINRYPY